MYRLLEVEREISSAKRKWSKIILTGWVFAKVFLRAEHARTRVLKVLLSTPDASFDINLALMTQQTIFLIENRNST